MLRGWSDVSSPDLTVAPPHHGLRHDEARPAGRVRWIEEKAAVRHQAGTRWRIIQYCGYLYLSNEIGPPFGGLGNTGRLVPHYLAPADKAVAVSQPDVAVFWRQEIQQRARIRDRMRPYAEPRRVRRRPGHGAQRNCGSGAHQSGRRPQTHFVIAFTILLLPRRSPLFAYPGKLRCFSRAAPGQAHTVAAMTVVVHAQGGSEWFRFDPHGWTVRAQAGEHFDDLSVAEPRLHPPAARDDP